MKDANDRLDLIIEMLLTLCGRNLEISFTETRDFAKRFEEIKKNEQQR